MFCFLINDFIFFNLSSVKNHLFIKFKSSLYLFVNLIHNAMGFSHPEDKVSIEISNAGKAIVIKVIDQGIGIKDKSSVLKNTIIRPTTKIDQKIGHGLGFKLAQRITTLHNGKFDINNNKDGKGVTATVKFPL